MSTPLAFQCQMMAFEKALETVLETVLVTALETAVQKLFI